MMSHPIAWHTYIYPDPGWEYQAFDDLFVFLFVGVALIIALPFILRRYRLFMPFRVRGRCPKCAYDLRGDTDEGCPECGWGREKVSESA